MKLAVELNQRGLAGMDTLHRKRNCTVASCGRAAITSLGQQVLCVNHFLLRCYEKLDGLDPRGRKFTAEPLDLAAMLGFIEECSRKALEVRLQCEELSNLKRGRLLDILLWAGELFLLLRAPRLTFAECMASADDGVVARAAAPNL